MGCFSLWSEGCYWYLGACLTVACPLAPPGLANSKTVDISPADGAVVLTKSKPSKGKGKPAKAKASTTMKKDMRRMAKAVSKEVGSFRPDLKVRHVPAFPARPLPGVAALACALTMEALTNQRAMPSASEVQS